MAFPQVIAAFHAIFDAIGLPGNLLVIITIILEKRFHVMRYILLASLAVSDCLFLILVNSFRIASFAQERWLYGDTMCHLNAFVARYCYLNTVLHLLAVSYERYCAIVKSPLTHSGTVTKSSVVLIVLIWVIPIPLSIGPFLGFAGKYYYNPELFFCEQGWTAQSGSSARNVLVSSIASFLVPFLVIVFLNWSVYKTAKIQIEALQVQIGSLAGSDDQQQDLTRRMGDRKAAVNITIIITAFLLCFLPSYIVGFFRHFAESTNVPAEVILLTSSIFIVSSLCNPIIYSIRKRDFRAGVRNVLRQLGLCGNSNDVIAMNDLGFRATLATEAITSTPIAAFDIQDQHGRMQSGAGGTSLNFQSRLSPIPELIEEDG
ncbi:octopamine receptor beta-2R-like [Oculina patagonica]